jgi:hypothetical protein
MVGGWGACLLVLLALVGCQWQPATGMPAAASSSPRPIILANGALYEAVEAPAAGQPALAEPEARTRAAGYVSGAANAGAVQARYVTLTVTSPDGVRPVAARTVWVVTFAGVPFVSEGCTCHGEPDRANTVVALDSGNGALVLLYGVGEGQAAG